MVIGDICGHSINWSMIEITRMRCKLILECNRKTTVNDPIFIFLNKITYECFIKNANKLTINECKLLKKRLNTTIKKWTTSKIKDQIKEFINLLERCINNRKCLYVYHNNQPLKLVV